MKRLAAVALPLSIALATLACAVSPTAPKPGVHRVPVCVTVTDTIYNLLPTGPRYFTIDRTVCT